MPAITLKLPLAGYAAEEGEEVRNTHHSAGSVDGWGLAKRIVLQTLLS
jgi:hypothetical protein